MYNAIKKFVEDSFESLSEEKQEKAREILRKYVNSDKDLRKTYESLVDEGLILETRGIVAEDVAFEVEETLKEFIGNKILNISIIEPEKG